ncbi:type II toxin-antitoxin system VapC family toxin [Candidatus Desantisbacteria bacterium]|nr:type II toxin-antitoxin system VapC family toxin [Candidatus Desantisbacteria bacterium]
MPIQISHAENLYKLPNHHKDPFDRMLISQAQVENLTIITSDLLFTQYDAKILW